MATKYFIEISAGNGYWPRPNWDDFFDTYEEAEEHAKRAAKSPGWSAIVSEIHDVPENVDHLYRNIADKNDETYLYP